MGPEEKEIFELEAEYRTQLKYKHHRYTSEQKLFHAIILQTKLDVPEYLEEVKEFVKRDLKLYCICGGLSYKTWKAAFERLIAKYE